MSECKQCGRCCRENGLIPPRLPQEEAPEWLRCLVNRLRTRVGFMSKGVPCVFLTSDNRCAIHDMERSSVCVNYFCPDCKET